MYLKVQKNTKGKDYVVGDIHGMYDLLMQTLNKLEFDFNRDRLFSVGDLVDRGPKNVEVMNLVDEEWFIPVRGNHEQFIAAVANYTYEPYIHQANGGQWYYGLHPHVQQDILDKVKTLPLMIETEVDGKTIGFVHGDINDWDTSVSIIKTLLEEDIDNDVTAQKLIWGRSRIKNRNAIPAKGIDHVFLGHTPLENIVTLGNCHFIDTAAIFGNKLTVLNISDFLKDK